MSRAADDSSSGSVRSGDEPFSSRGDRGADAGRAVMTGLVGAVPIVGTPVAAALESAWPSRWQRRVERLVTELESRVRYLDSVQLERDEVVTAMALAMRSAVVSDDEKIAYLAAAVANATANPDEWEHDTVVVLMRVVAELTATHFRVLDLVADPSAWIARTGVLIEQQPRGDGLYRLTDDIGSAMRRAGAASGDIDLVLGDLEALGLLDAIGFGNEKGSPSPKSIDLDLASPLGRRVHRFVTWTD